MAIYSRSLIQNFDNWWFWIKEEELKATKNKTENIKEVTDFVEAIALINEIKSIQRDVDYRKLKIISGNNVTYDFIDYKTFKELLWDIYYENMSIDEAKQKQNGFNAVINDLSRYTPRNQKHIESKNKLLDNPEHFYKRREKIIEEFKNKIFPIYHDDEYSRFKDDEENDIIDRNGLINYDLKRRDIDDELFREYFKYQYQSYMLESLKDTKNTERKEIQANWIKSALTDFKNKIKNISKNEIEFEQPNEIAGILLKSYLKILEFNRRNQ